MKQCIKNTIRLNFIDTVGKKLTGRVSRKMREKIITIKIGIYTQIFFFFNIKSLSIRIYAAFAAVLLTNSFIFSVDKDLGRSMGRPRPRSQTKEANTPRARETPNNTV